MTQNPYRPPSASEARPALPFAAGLGVVDIARVQRSHAWIGDNPAGVIELTDRELREALSARSICSENASISTTWCDNPNVC